MIVSVLLFLAGIVCLIKGGDWFVDGAVSIARRFSLPELLIGATVVSVGTTLPEVMVSATSALGGQGEIAYGNAVGSVICNTALIAAITVAIRPGKINRERLLMPVLFFFGAAIIYSGVVYSSGYFSRGIGALLLAIFFLYIFLSIRGIKNNRERTEEKQKNGLTGNAVKTLVVGAVVIAVGARLVVDNGTVIAAKLGVPQSVIALTFVALGTSLPELVTAITSLVKGHGALSLGNIIGANLFNLVLVSGISVFLSPFSIPQSSSASRIVDIPVMLAVMFILTVPPLVKGRMSRIQGIVLLAIYAAFCVLQFAM